MITTLTKTQMSNAVKPIKGLTFGADPELFVMNPDGEFVCPDGIIPGTKEEPHPVEYGAVQVDGMAAEFNIEPVNNFTDWYRNIRSVEEQLADFLPAGYSLVNTPTAEFTQENWDAAPSHAKMLGCSPDFNAWEGTTNSPPDNEERVRYAGGHIHAGFTKNASMADFQYYEQCLTLAKQLDWYLGAWSITQDPDHRRRTMYGRAGSMRFKPEYGMEYRTLSNFWLKDDKTLLECWNRMILAMNNIRYGTMEQNAKQYDFDGNKLLIESIDSSVLDNELSGTFYFPVVSIDQGL